MPAGIAGGKVQVNERPCPKCITDVNEGVGLKKGENPAILPLKSS